MTTVIAATTIVITAVAEVVVVAVVGVVVVMVVAMIKMVRAIVVATSAPAPSLIDKVILLCSHFEPHHWQYISEKV